MSEIEIQRRERVAVLTLNAPERRNALSPQMAIDLDAAICDLESDESVGALVIYGAKGSFCSGADLRALADASTDPTHPHNMSSLGAIYSLFTRIVDSRIPTIAAAAGPAVGAGINLALACDLLIVAPSCRFISFHRAQLHPGGGHMWLLERQSRTAHAALALFAQPLLADDLHRLGIAWQVVAEDELLDRACEIATSAVADIGLTRAVTATWRTTSGDVATHRAAVATERSAQMWSLRRKQDLGG